ncbi:hypothetical protein SERLADRAFT_464319 [Serpula lacrymans var. lacrymans S7.9]|uniref:Protein YOP1 n=1 Tax=Serpula lacrymans var. lacrymans (strain S7.9) TaxID=578457 RepID=F8NRT9_SERL9|nr:uncharacterized protein SERLADRAFT_464319 [Serpula lacrymans var. lacrymans S7.9]EGO26825.1 hypothetical protein SERLADRAFT_464319 [Serpula lacrymans var. lacrymans S7.9]
MHRVPFYYPMKTIFLLYLALPQTRGSSYIYVNHLQPFFHSHESQIDATLASFKARVYSFVQERFRAIWDHVAAAIGQQQAASFTPSGGETRTGAPPSLGDPISGPSQLVSGLWRSYGPSIVASGAALMRQSTAAAGSMAADRAWQSFTNSPAGRPAAPPREVSSQSAHDRRRQLEAELAFLSERDTTAGTSAVAVPPLPIPPPSGSYQASRTSSESDLRERGTGKFEEIDIPSDVEGYDVDGNTTDRGRKVRPGAKKNPSWFGGWGGSGTEKEGYERVKTE